MTTLRWLHLSDFHTGKDGYGQRRLFQYILEHVKFKIDSNLAPNFIFITGDIANKGQADQYLEFNEKFLLPLISLLPQETQNCVYLIPGNHDVDRKQTRAVQTYDILVKIPEFLDPNARGQFERKQAVFPRFRTYTENDLINTGEHWLFSQEGVFNSIISFESKKIGVLGINTAWLSCSDYDRHQLSPGKPLLEDGLENIKDCDLNIVLGHHPLNWLLDEEVEAIRSLLGRHNVIYLHGHMHKNKSKYEDGAGFPFLSLQSGACFQAREDEKWVNRFLWCEMDLEARKISAEPLQWSRDNCEWVIDPLAFPEKYRQGDRWIVSLPAPSSVESKPVKIKMATQKFREMPTGWVIVDKKYLKSLASELTAKQAISFFDGRSPIWRDALAPQIPRREIVQKILNILGDARIKRGVQVTLLTGAAGEGKTTALLQTICDLVKSSDDWHILWHDNPSSPFPSRFIANLPQGGTWLIVSDDAEVIARRVYETTQLLISERDDIQFLLCCRDTDWKAEGANRFDWKRYHIDFVEVPLRGLSSTDAEEVVSAWGRYGKDGLKSLKNLTLKDASIELIQTAKSEETVHSEGSFFGAILQVRLGEDLKNHIRNLLEKLSTRFIGKNRTLRDAFIYIAALHSEKLLFLSKEVLAEVLEINPVDLKREVLFPLGEEAVIATTGRFVFTRHIAIASVVLQILSEETDIDPENLFIDLSQSAVRAFLEGKFIPNISDWNYLASHFFMKGNQALAIKIAQGELEVDSNNPFSTVKLTHFYRESGQAEQSVRIFRSTKSMVRRNERPFLYEWGAAEGNVGNYANNVHLSAYSLSDEAVRRRPDNEQAKISLNGMSIAFAELHERFNEPIFIEACAAAVQLGFRLYLDSKTKTWLKRSQQRVREAGIADYSPQDALEKLKQGINAAWEEREDDLPDWVMPTSTLNFNGLAKLLRI